MSWTDLSLVMNLQRWLARSLLHHNRWSTIALYLISILRHVFSIVLSAWHWGLQLLLVLSLTYDLLSSLKVAVIIGQQSLISACINLCSILFHSRRLSTIVIGKVLVCTPVSLPSTLRRSPLLSASSMLLSSIDNFVHVWHAWINLESLLAGFCPDVPWCILSDWVSHLILYLISVLSFIFAFTISSIVWGLLTPLSQLSLLISSHFNRIQICLRLHIVAIKPLSITTAISVKIVFISLLAWIQMCCSSLWYILDLIIDWINLHMQILHLRIVPLHTFSVVEVIILGLSHWLWNSVLFIMGLRWLSCQDYLLIGDTS